MIREICGYSFVLAFVRDSEASCEDIKNNCGGVIFQLLLFF